MNTDPTRMSWTRQHSHVRYRPTFEFLDSPGDDWDGSLLRADADPSAIVEDSLEYDMAETVAVFPAAMDAGEILYHMAAFGYAVDGYACSHTFDCCGCFQIWPVDIMPGPFFSVAVMRAYRNV